MHFTYKPVADAVSSMSNRLPFLAAHPLVMDCVDVWWWVKMHSVVRGLVAFSLHLIPRNASGAACLSLLF